MSSPTPIPVPNPKKPNRELKNPMSDALYRSSQEHGERKKMNETPPFRGPTPGSPKPASSSSNPDQEREGPQSGKSCERRERGSEKITFPSMDLLGCPH
ncbi:hypothetical protein B296_00013166 [Ensete ventricosum]|uniref:Uncharacterized protein n=1 Tax=Ensete ventricosum TaxID=4639 RepID=A0A427ASB9_ENSVE|nr:hypothetical protein B296_00013166 [Ensete ventricosum]